MFSSVAQRIFFSFVSLQFLFVLVCAKDILKLSSFQECPSNAEIVLNDLDTEYDASTKSIKFDISGRSTKSQKVTVNLKVEAYGKDVYIKDFDPCDKATLVEGLCPGKTTSLFLWENRKTHKPTVPVGNFSAANSQVIPPEAASQIPSIAFSIPDIALQATLSFKNVDGKNVGCVVADLGNGRTINSPTITYIAAGVVAAALLISGATTLLGANGGGDGGPASGFTPNFTEMIGWFQTLATSGMLSVNYPPLYREFTERFAFSTGLISWPKMQASINTFRSKTGGNTTANNLSSLKNTTGLATRDLPVISNATAPDTSTNLTQIPGIQKYVVQTGILPQNTFMTVFLIACIVILVICVSILLFKAILEAWSLLASFPKSLTTFRKRYWGTIFRTNVLLINTFYGTWVLYCILQFKSGDSWAATILAAVTLALFSGILVFFVVRIYLIARRHIKNEGSAAGLFENKRLWLKYSLFYDTYHKKSWWFFTPLIVYNLIRYTLLATLDGRGLPQTIALLTCETLLLILFIFVRPFERKRENAINITTQTIRALSMAIILVFVDELKVERSTQTIMGFALVIISSVLSVVLVILMVVNALYACFQDNPHRKKRKAAGKNSPTLHPLLRLANPEPPEKQMREEEAFIDPRHLSTEYRPGRL